MHSIAFRILASNVYLQEEQCEQFRNERIARRQLRDASNPLDLPQSLFQKYYRVNKPAFRYLLEVLIEHSPPGKNQTAVAPIVKLSGCLRFFAEGGYQTGIGKDYDVSVAQSTFSIILTEVVN